ncbi:MAG: response regulator [Muribaculaceae bacterium]|nr:response regulator [Muribaculaceae bacterium]
MKIVIIDDNPGVRSTLRLILEDEFEEVVTTGDPRLIPALLRNGDTDGVLLDMNFNSNRLDGADGLFWLERIREMDLPPAVVVITAFGEVSLAVEAMKKGAEDFVIKPWDNDVLISKLREAIRRNRIAISQSAALTEAERIGREESDRMAMTLEQVKLKHVKEIVAQCEGNLSAAAERLGINRQTLYNLLKKG